MLLFPLMTFLVIFGPVFGAKDPFFPEVLNEIEKNIYYQCVQEEEKKGPDPKGVCETQCYLKALGAIGTNKINVKNIWDRIWEWKGTDSGMLPNIIRGSKENKELGLKILKNLEANCSFLKATGRCELGKKVEDCFAKTVEVEGNFVNIIKKG